MKKTAIILFTGDRIEYIDYTIKSCLDFLKKGKIESNADIYVITYSEYINSNFNIKILKTNKPEDKEVIKFPMTRQTLGYNESDKFRINYGIYILFSQTPDQIFKNRETFINYDYILKCRSDLIFETPEFNFNENNLYTFECFWGGCRYNKRYTNDHLIFGKSEEVLKVISKKEDSDLSKFWNPEEYMTHLYLNSSLNKVELTTDKYYLISKDRESRKFIGYPMESINKNDLEFFNKIELDWKKIKFTNKYDF
jgi:hypothetical protein